MGLLGWALTALLAGANPAPGAPPELVRLEDLAPHFAQVARARAAAAFAARDFAAARRLLSPEGEGPPVRYLRALCSLELGEAEAAARALAALAPDYPRLADRLRAQAGAAFEKAGLPAEAAEQYRQVAASSTAFADARLGLARALAAGGRTAEAGSALSPLLDRPEPESGRDVAAEALWTLARLGEAEGDETLRSGALRRLWSEHPRSAEAARAEPLLSPSERTVEARLARGERLVEAHHNRPGIAVLEPLVAALKLPDPRACRAGFALGDALRKERRHREAIRRLEPVVAACRDRDLLPRALYALASSRSIATPETGPGLYERLARDFPDHRAGEVRLYAAALDLRAGKKEAARARLEELGTREPRGRLGPEALFKLFWLERAAGRHGPALAYLERISAAGGGPAQAYELQRAEYWRARTLGELGDPQAEAERLSRLASDHPATWYGSVALRRLEELDGARAARARGSVRKPPPARSPWPLRAGKLADDPRLWTGIELLRLGLKDEARGELLGLRRAGLDPAAARLLAHLLSACGDEASAQLIARVSLRGELERTPTAATRATWDLAYPRAHRALIERHCRAAGVDPDLLQALIREESAYDANARSWAGALGLTQLLPERGARLAKPAGVRFKAERLFEPEISIRLGCAHLGDLLREFDGEVAYAFAAYNAEPERVRTWLSRKPGRPIDEFVEEIPFEETRGYVKRLVRSVEAYRLLYGRAGR